MATTPRQLIDQSTRHAVYLERLKSHEVKAFEAFLRDLDRSIRASLSGPELTDFSLKRLRRQEAAIAAAMKVTLDEFREVFRAQIIGLAEYEAGFEARNLSKVAVTVDFDLPSEQQLISAVFSRPLQMQGAAGGLLLEPFIRRWETGAIDSVMSRINVGYAQGLTNAQILRTIRGTAAEQFADGTIAQINRQTNAMMRTVLQHAAGQARQATWERNRDIVRGVRILATLDDRTSEECRSLDGTEWPIDQGPRPPFHVSCRTSTIAVLDDRFAILDEGGTRIARDEEGEVGRVPAKQTYYEWLQTQSPDFQDSVIGPTRGVLLRDGGLSAGRFAELQLGKTFEPLTLAEMRRLEPLAFERAGI